MLAGGIGNAEADDAIKEVPEADMSVVVMGGDNYRIGMGGGAVSSVATKPVCQCHRAECGAACQSGDAETCQQCGARSG